MQRPIKFRVWDGKRMHQPALELHDGKVPKRLPPTGPVAKNPKFIWLQFTGLLDKNDTEVYEGDVISDQDSMVKPVMEVYWRPESGAWWVKSPIDGGGSELHQYRGWMEVIGNIYENPDLLRKE